ncbi:hypothetical protein PBRA_006816 [Plasmodiophora brassicae]|nr:hypothetical protein PBRA_006816 [Plasmodiophora brassicae]
MPGRLHPWERVRESVLRLMSAINIPDMSRVLAAHDLIPAPVDVMLLRFTLSLHLLIGVRVQLTMGTLLPDLKQLDALLQLEKVVALIVINVYWWRNPLDRILAMIRIRGTPVIENCAESFDGLAFRGILAMMCAQHATYPVQSSSAYAQKAGKMVGPSN